MSNPSRSLLAGSLLILFSLGAHLSAQTESEIGLSWDSRYVTEGRENIPGSGLVSTYGKFPGDHLVAGYWLASGDSSDFNEVQVWAGSRFELGPADVLAHYTYLNFGADVDNSNDHELALEVRISDIGHGISPFFSYKYAHVAEGGFFEFGVERNFSPANRLSLGPYLLVGVNNGFVEDEHKGWNNVQAGINLTYSRSDSLGIHAYVAFSQGLQEEPGESLKDLFWVGVNLSKSF